MTEPPLGRVVFLTIPPSGRVVFLNVPHPFNLDGRVASITPDPPSGFILAGRGTGFTVEPSLGGVIAKTFLSPFILSGRHVLWLAYASRPCLIPHVPPTACASGHTCLLLLHVLPTVRDSCRMCVGLHVPPICVPPPACASGIGVRNKNVASEKREDRSKH